MEQNLVHGEGDYYGEPFRLRAWQQALVWRAYELRPDGRRRYKRVLWGFPKGNGKTELAAAMAVAELAGPARWGGWWEDGRPRAVPQVSPDIPVGAASFDQADLLFGAARAMIRGGPIGELCEVYDTEVLLKDRPGRLYRVAAALGTNDGKRPSFFVADELHEWEGKKERVHLILSNGCAKRKESWELAISTAGWDSSSLLGRWYQQGKAQQAAADTRDGDGFLFEWYEPRGEWNLGEADQLERAIREANPAVEDFLMLENIARRYGEIPEFEFRRYHLNQWVSAPERWLPTGAWDALHVERVIPDGATIVLGFDGSYAGDSTAIVGSTMDGHVFVVGCWEKPEAGPTEWRVDVLDVEAAIHAACARWQVRLIGCDPYRWQRSLAVLQQQGLPVIEWPSHLPSHMVPACAQFYDAVTSGSLSHDGDPRLAAHLANAIVKIDSRGPRITKDHKDSKRHIDLAVAAIIANDLRHRQETKVSIYEERGPLGFG